MPEELFATVLFSAISILSNHPRGHSSWRMVQSPRKGSFAGLTGIGPRAISDHGGDQEATVPDLRIHDL